MTTTTEVIDLKRKKKSHKLRRLITLISCIFVLCSMFAVSTFADENTPATVAETGSGMADLVETIFSTFTTVIEGLANGLKSAFTNLIYTDSSATQFSPLVLFIFTMAGIALAAGILYKIFGLIQARRRG
jgi:hypothetical protein